MKQTYTSLLMRKRNDTFEAMRPALVVLGAVLAFCFCSTMWWALVVLPLASHK